MTAGTSQRLSSTPLALVMDALFAEIEASQQQFVDRTSSQTEQLKEAVLSLRQEVASQRQENSQLRAENQLLRGGGVPTGTGYGGPVYGEPVYSAVPAYASSAEYKQAKIIRTHEGPVHAVTMGPQGLLATASWDATVQLYDLSKGDDEALIRTLGQGEEDGGYQMNGLYGVAFAKTVGNVLGCVSADTCVYIWNHQTGELLSRLEGHQNEVNGISFHPTQHVMVTASDDCTAVVWDFQQSMKLRSLDAHTKAVYGASFLSVENQYCVATCCFDLNVRIFDMRDRSVAACLENCHTDDIIGIDFTDKTRQLATGSDDGVICIFDERNWGEPLYRINTRENPGIANNEVKRVCYSLDGRRLACGSSSQQVLVYDLSGSEPTFAAALPGHQDCVFDVCWGVDANGAEYLVDASHDLTSFVWRPAA